MWSRAKEVELAEGKENVDVGFWPLGDDSLVLAALWRMAR
jgi:hypothetical protein